MPELPRPVGRCYFEFRQRFASAGAEIAVLGKTAYDHRKVITIQDVVIVDKDDNLSTSLTNSPDAGRRQP